LLFFQHYPSLLYSLQTDLCSLFLYFICFLLSVIFVSYASCNNSTFTSLFIIYVYILCSYLTFCLSYSPNKRRSLFLLITFLISFALIFLSSFFSPSALSLLHPNPTLLFPSLTPLLSLNLIFLFIFSFLVASKHPSTLSHHWKWKPYKPYC